MMLPARQAIIPEIVDRDQVMNAVALNTLGMNVFRLAAPAAAGFLIAAYDFKAVYFAMTIMNVYAIVLVSFVPPTGKAMTSTTNIISDIRDCFSYVMRERLVMLILVFTLFVVILSQPYQQMLPIFVDDILGVGEKGMGILMSVSGAGAMVGSLILASSPNRKRGFIMLVSGLVSGLALTWFSFSTNWHLSIAAIVFVGLGQTTRATLSSALLQSYVESSYMGRVMSIFMMEWGLVSFVTFIAGILSEVIPVQWVVGGFAMALVVISVSTIVFSPRIRKLD